MPLAMSGENIKLTRPLCHELWKMVLKVLFSYTLSYMEKNIKAPPNVAQVTGNIRTGELFQHLVHAISYVSLVKISCQTRRNWSGRSGLDPTNFRAFGQYF